MAPRTSWKGYLKLSLISIPVKAFTAHETGSEIRLNQLHKECHQRVKYQKVCPEHGELSQKDIVSGYEFAKDQYVVIEPGELNKLRPESDKAVRIQGFIAEDQIDPIYQAGKTYYLLPDGVAGDKPYALLHKGLTERGVVGLAQLVISGREQLVMLRTLDDLLVISVLHPDAKVKPVENFTGELPDLEVAQEEVALTDTLIEHSLLEDFDYSAFKDDYVERLRELIQLKIEGKEVVEAPDVEEPRILNLMDALKRSVAEAQASAASEGKRVGGTGEKASRKTGKKKGTKRKMAPSASKKKTKKKASGRKRKSG